MRPDPNILVFTFFSLLLAFAAYALFSVVTASGNIAYCYIELGYNKTYDLKGKIYWRPNDIVIAEATSPEELIIKANKLHCKLGSEPK